MQDLTPRQRDVLAVILGSIEERGRFPSIREIARRLRLASPATVFQHLKALATKGYLRHEQRCWTIARETRRARGIPILGRVAAGTPQAAIEEIEGMLTAESLGLRSGRFAVRVSGESMAGEGILDGDCVIVDPALPVANGDLVVAYLGEGQEVTVKRLRWRRAHVELRPANPRFRTIRVRRGDPFLRIAGKVTGLFRHL